MSHAVSIIICSAGRPESLRETLISLENIRIPADVQCELIVVDNNPSDSREGESDTRLAVSAIATDAPFTSLYVREPIPGVSRAKNSGIAAASGEILLMTDDDVRPEPDWLARMTAPLRDGACDAVAGGIKLAPYLQRPWMADHHKSLLASTEWKSATDPMPAMIGANMAFHRRILEKVPYFDVELGPGTRYGGGEEILFSFQVIEAGFRLKSQLDVVVEHRTDVSRVGAASFAARAARAGCESAYIRYHWEQEPVGHVKRNTLRSLIDMWKAARDSKNSGMYEEGISEDQLRTIHAHNFYRHYLFERRKPRHYDRRGLIKKHGVLAPPVGGISEKLLARVGEEPKFAHRH